MTRCAHALLSAKPSAQNNISPLYAQFALCACVKTAQIPPRRLYFDLCITCTVVLLYKQSRNESRQSQL